MGSDRIESRYNEHYEFHISLVYFLARGKSEIEVNILVRSLSVCIKYTQFYTHAIQPHRQHTRAR